MAAVDNAQAPDPSIAASGGSSGAGPLVIRAFGWSILTAMAVFLLNNYLIFWQDWPGIAPILGWDAAHGDAPGVRGWIQFASYVLAIGGASLYAFLTPRASLREEARRIARANTFFIRACFWSVFLVGLADAAISFLRVEGLLAPLVGDQLATDLGRSQFRGPWIHIPLIVFSILLASVTRTLGFTWLALLVVVAELQIVLTRFVFSYEQAFMGDLVRFWYAALFLFASAYTLLEEGHVRVDVFYMGFSSRLRGFVNAIGSIFLGLSLCWTVLLVGMWGKTYVINSPLLAYEVSQSGFGMYVKYLMAGFLAVFAISMMIQFVSYLFESVADFRREPGGRDHDVHAIQ